MGYCAYENVRLGMGLMLTESVENKERDCCVFLQLHTSVVVDMVYNFAITPSYKLLS